MIEKVKLPKYLGERRRLHCFDDIPNKKCTKCGCEWHEHWWTDDRDWCKVHLRPCNSCKWPDYDNPDQYCEDSFSYDINEIRELNK